MASSSSIRDEIPYEDEGIIEAMSCNFESSVDMLDLEGGIDLVGVLIAGKEPNAMGIKAAIQNMWKQLRQIKIIPVNRNVFAITAGSEKLAQKLLTGNPWNVKGYCFSVRPWPHYHAIEEIESSRAVFWIQAHGIPKEQLLREIGRRLE